MKKFFSLIGLLLLARIGSTQCSLELFLQTMPVTCEDGPVESYVVINLMNCPDAAMTSYHWELIQDGQTLASADTFMPEYSGFTLPNNGTFSLCLTVTVLDGIGNLLVTESECNTVSGGLGLSFCSFNVLGPENCSLGGCANIQICGGAPPYSIYVDGQSVFLDPNNTMFPSCNLDPGFYTVEVADGNGCYISETFTIPDFSSDNTHAVLFYDSNNDGEYANGFLTEPLLGNQAIHFIEPDITIFTDSNGSFTLENLAPGDYTVEWIDNSDIYDISPFFNSSATVPSCIEIPLVAASNTMLQVSGPSCIWMMDIHCTNGFNPGLYVENTGSVNQRNFYYDVR
jgi:hypothetical protein